MYRMYWKHDSLHYIVHSISIFLAWRTNHEKQQVELADSWSSGDWGLFYLRPFLFRNFVFYKFNDLMIWGWFNDTKQMQALSNVNSMCWITVVQKGYNLNIYLQAPLQPDECWSLLICKVVLVKFYYDQQMMLHGLQSLKSQNQY